LLKLPEEQVKGNYERDMAPDPHVYYFSSAPTADASTIRDFQINMPKIMPRYEGNQPLVRTPRLSGKEPRTFLCDLCGAIFRRDDELSSHIA
jgi:hypothetical protein